MLTVFLSSPASVREVFYHPPRCQRREHSDPTDHHTNEGERSCCVLDWRFDRLGARQGCYSWLCTPIGTDSEYQVCPSSPLVHVAYVRHVVTGNMAIHVGGVAEESESAAHNLA